MDNLTLRRILFVIGIVIVGICSIMLAYGMFTGNNLYVYISIAGVVVAYLISRYVSILQKQSKVQK